MDTLGNVLARLAYKVLITGAFRRVSEGTRTPDRLDHNQELYQLSYAHRETAESTSAARRAKWRGSALSQLGSMSDGVTIG
jgi:hypothetical protein